MILFQYCGTIYRAGITPIKRLDSSVIPGFDYLGCVSFGEYLGGYRYGEKVDRETSNRQITPDTTHVEVCGDLSIDIVAHQLLSVICKQTSSQYKIQHSLTFSTLMRLEEKPPGRL